MKIPVAIPILSVAVTAAIALTACSTPPVIRDAGPSPSTSAAAPTYRTGPDSAVSKQYMRIPAARTRFWIPDLPPERGIALGVEDAYGCTGMSLPTTPKGN